MSMTWRRGLAGLLAFLTTHLFQGSGALVATSENCEGMATELVWRQSQLADGIEAKGASGGLYIVMSFPGLQSLPGIYLASYRSSFSEEPHYFASFPLTPSGLATAKAACQSRESRRNATLALRSQTI